MFADVLARIWELQQSGSDPAALRDVFSKYILVANLAKKPAGRGFPRLPILSLAKARRAHDDGLAQLRAQGHHSLVAHRLGVEVDQGRGRRDRILLRGVKAPFETGLALSGAPVRRNSVAEFRVIGDLGEQAPHANSMDRHTGSKGSTPRMNSGREPVWGSAQRDSVLFRGGTHPRFQSRCAPESDDWQVLACVLVVRLQLDPHSRLTLDQHLRQGTGGRPRPEGTRLEARAVIRWPLLEVDLRSVSCLPRSYAADVGYTRQ